MIMQKTLLSLFVVCTFQNVARVGYVEIKEHFLLDIFGEYSYEKTVTCSDMANVYSSGSVQIDGLAFGLSLGYAF